MLEPMLKLPGVIAVAHFKDNATADVMEAHGSLDTETLRRLARFSLDHKRMGQGLIDVFGMFKPTCCAMDWTPLNGWVVRGDRRSICSWAGLVCIIENDEASVNQILKQLCEIADLI